MFCSIFWESKNFEGKTDKVEQWYGTAYSIEKISGPLIQVCRLIVILFLLEMCISITNLGETFKKLGKIQFYPCI